MKKLSQTKLPLAFRLCQFGELSKYYANFPLNDNCFLSVLNT